MGTMQPANIETVPKSSVDLAVLSKRVGSAGPEMKERGRERERKEEARSIRSPICLGSEVRVFYSSFASAAASPGGQTSMKRVRKPNVVSRLNMTL